VCISVLQQVRNFGPVVTWSVLYIAKGDTFETESDIEDPSLWRGWSYQPQLQAVSRYNAVAQHSVDFIVPGHGPMFHVTEHYVELLKNASLT